MAWALRRSGHARGRVSFAETYEKPFNLGGCGALGHCIYHIYRDLEMSVVAPDALRRVRTRLFEAFKQLYIDLFTADQRTTSEAA